MPCSGKVCGSARASRFGCAIGRRHRIEAGRRALVLDPERGAEERQDRLAGHGRELSTKTAKSTAVMRLFRPHRGGNSPSSGLSKIGPPGLAALGAAHDREVDAFAIVSLRRPCSAAARGRPRSCAQQALRDTTPGLAAARRHPDRDLHGQPVPAQFDRRDRARSRRRARLSPAEIGLLSSAFFLAFAAAQIPLGMALDRFGPSAACLICAASCLGLGRVRPRRDPAV